MSQSQCALDASEKGAPAAPAADEEGAPAAHDVDGEGGPAADPVPAGASVGEQEWDCWY